jgi:hypothetical protein
MTPVPVTVTELSARKAMTPPDFPSHSWAVIFFELPTETVLYSGTRMTWVAFTGYPCMRGAVRVSLLVLTGSISRANSHLPTL